MVHILPNSVCDLTPQQVEELGVTAIPDYIAFSPTEQYRNNIEIDPPTLYRRLADCEELPKTAHPNLEQFMQAFQAAAAEPGCTELLCLSLTKMCIRDSQVHRAGVRVCQLGLHGAPALLCAEKAFSGRSLTIIPPVSYTHLFSGYTSSCRALCSCRCSG